MTRRLHLLSQFFVLESQTEYDNVLKCFVGKGLRVLGCFKTLLAFGGLVEPSLSYPHENFFLTNA